MAKASITVGKRGAHEDGAITGNPFAATVIDTTTLTSGSWPGSATFVLPDDTGMAGMRAVLILTDTEIDYGSTADYEPTASIVPTRIFPPTGGVVAYTALIPSTNRNIWLRRPA